MKKNIVIALGLLLLLAACDRKAFVKKIVGTYGLDKYLFAGLDKTRMYDTTYRDWQLTIADDQVYTKSWMTFTFRPDSTITYDTISVDTLTGIPTQVDTNRYYYIDTGKFPHFEVGKWELINSEEDLQLKNDSSSAVEIYRILELTKSNLNLRKGNEEFYLSK